MRWTPAALVVLAFLGGDGTRAAPIPASPDKRPAHVSADERVLQAVHLPTSGPALLEFFRKQTRAEADPAKAADLVRRLQDRRPTAHQPAMAELVALGTAAVPLLRQAANSLDDLEAAERAKHCLQYTDGSMAAPLAAASVRVLVQRRPAGAVAVLLDYLPATSDGNVVREITSALAALAYRDGKLEPALLQALYDAVPIRRRVSAQVLGQVGKPEHLEAISKLYQDPKPTVRLQAALGRAQRHFQDGVPVLIDLLPELPPEQRREAESYLWSLAGEWNLSLPQGHDETARRLHRELWAAWWRDTDGPKILEEVRKRTLSDPERERIQGLIDRLGDEAFAAREQAAAALLPLGPKAAPLLRRASGHADTQVRQYAARCLQIIEKDRPTPLPAAALRLLMLRRPPGTVATLLAYLPCAETDALAGQVQSALAVVAFPDGKPDPALLQCLQDRTPERRVAAAELLLQHGGDADATAVRKLLDDPSATVRLQVALALADRREKDALPVLIALLAEVVPEQASEIEDYLQYVAGAQAPAGAFAPDQDGRRKCREGWEAWWRKSGPALDLAKLDRERGAAGRTLILDQGDAGRGGRALIVEPDGRVAWQLEGLQSPTDAHLLPGDRVLLIEQHQNQRVVTERDAKGATHWQKVINNGFPIACQRLANGNTFIVCNSLLVEARRDGADVFTHNRGTYDIAAGRKLRNGEFVYFTQTGTCVRLDNKGKEIKSYRIPNPNNIHFGGPVQILPNGHVLVPQYGGAAKLVEYNTHGKAVREVPVPAYPTSVARLPNGHLLLASVQAQSILELDRKGNTVWEFKNPSLRPLRAGRVERLP